MSGNAINVPSSEKACAFCDYISGRRPFTILHRTDLIAVLITREQRGVGHVLVVPLTHRSTLLDLEPDEARAIMAAVIDCARAIDRAFKPGGIAVWQNNGSPANQKIPHVHFHIAGTLPEGGTEFGDVPELPIDETDRIGGRLGPFLSGNGQ